MERGSNVRLKPTEKASGELRRKVEDLGEVTAKVADMTGIGVCTIVLPEGVVIEGHSHPLNDDQHYMDIHREHLEEVPSPPPSNGDRSAEKGDRGDDGWTDGDLRGGFGDDFP